MSEHDQSLLSDAAQKCLGLAELLKGDGQKRDAVILRDGASRFSSGIEALREVDALLGIIRRSFSEDGPRLPILIEELMNLQHTGDESHTLSAEPPKTLGGIPFTIDRDGAILENFNTNLPEWIIRECRKPTQTRGVLRYLTGANFTNYTKAQQVITEAFFQQDGSELTQPTLADIYAYYLGEHHRFPHIYESSLDNYRVGFCSQAGQVLHKIRHLGSYSAEDYHKAVGLRKFKEEMRKVIFGYEDFIDGPVTPEILEKIALREIQLARN